MGPQEGLDHLLRAAASSSTTWAGTTSPSCGGGGTAFDSLRALADELGLDEQVEFTGRVPDDELVNRLCTADVCVNPDPKNAFNDACVMNKILEYMSGTARGQTT